MRPPGRRWALFGPRWLRAHKYLRSSQSLVDFSLTHLYRVAERHRGAKSG